MSKPKAPIKNSNRSVTETVATYHIKPTGCLGRLLAFALASIILTAAFFLSIFIFWVVLSVVLFLIVIAWWTSRRVGRQEGKIIDAEIESQRSKTRRSNRSSRH